MNRAERRKNKKNGCNERGEKILHLTQRQLDSFIRQAIREKQQSLLETVSTNTVNTMLLFTMDILHNKFGFGHLRLKRFKYFMDELCEVSMDDEDAVNTLYSELHEKVNLDFLSRSVEREEVFDFNKIYGEGEVVAPYPWEENKNEL